MTTTDPIIDSDLNAYVDGELSVPRRIEVEAYLSEHPDMAAKVMADLSLRGELRLALAGDQGFGRAETREAARRLERGLSQGRIFQTLQRMAAVAVLVSAGWVAHTTFGAFTATEVNASVPAPTYVEDAVRAYRTALLRQTVPSQSKAAYKPEDIRAATAIVMPDLPKDWIVRDVQIFPSDYGPSVEMAASTKGGAELSLFAVRPGVFAVQPVRQVAVDNAQAAYWQIGDVAYALVAADKTLNLDGTAEALSRSLY